MKRLVWTTLLAAMAMASPSFARAADAWIVNNVNLQSGPDADYPVVASLDGGTDVSIQGCTPNWSWCDVIAYGDRGWVPGNDLEYAYQNQWVPVPAYAEYIGIPVVSFSINSYWDSYYRQRPFYAERDHWYGRSFPNRWEGPNRRTGPIDVPPPHPIAGRPPVVAPLPHSFPGALHDHPINLPPPHSMTGSASRVAPLPRPIQRPPVQQAREVRSAVANNRDHVNR